MALWENLKQAINLGAALDAITPAKTAFDDEDFDDTTALGLVLSDATAAKQYASSKGLPQQWNRNDDLYRAYVQAKTWPGSNETRAHLSMPVVLEAIETLLPQLHLAFFSDKTPFILSAQGTTAPDTARAAAKILKWAIKRSGFKEEIRKTLKSSLQQTTGVGMWGWEQGEEEKKSYSKEGKDVVSSSEAKRYTRPTFEYVELGNLLVDPALRTPDIRNARFVIRQKFVTANELDELRNDDTYKNIPSRQELRDLMAPVNQGATDNAVEMKVQTWREYQAQNQRLGGSTDPLQQPLEILEYWTSDRVIAVLQGTVVIRNDENPYETLPFVSCPYIDVLGSFHGFGVPKLLEGEQALQTGVMNKGIDSLDLSLNPMFSRKKGTGTGGSQNVKAAPGKVVNEEEITPIITPNVFNDAVMAVQNSDSRARRRVGANSGPDMPNQAMRTAEGVQEFTAGIQIRTQYFVEMFADFVFVPVLEAFLGMAKDNMTPDDINCVLTEEEGHSWDGDHLNFYNGLYGIEVLSSTKLAAKRSMVSLVPVLMQLFASAPVQQAFVIQNKKVDLAELVKQVIELTGWDSQGLIVDMTPDDQQRAMMQNPAVIKGQQEMAQISQEHQNDLELESAKGDVRGGIQVIKHVLDQSAEPAEPLATRPAK